MNRELSRPAQQPSESSCGDEALDWRSAHEWLARLAATPNVANAEEAADAIIYQFLSQLGHRAVANAWCRVYKRPVMP
jgi:hypothetical protein